MLDEKLHAGLFSLDNDEDIDAAEAVLKHRRAAVLTARINAVMAGPDFVKVKTLDGGTVHEVSKEVAAGWLTARTHVLA
jgi:hypothetical protein